MQFPIVRNSTFYQYCAIICANICAISCGTAYGWTSSAFLVLESNVSPLEQGPLSSSEIAWVGSLIGIGGIAGTLLTCWMYDRFGRKLSLLITAVPILISWILIIYATNAWYLYASRFLAGISGGGVYVLIPLLVGEISEDNIRGALGAIITVSGNAGVLIGFIAGSYLSYDVVPKVLLIFPAIFFLLYIFFPESPWYLIKTNQLEEAKKSLRFYRNINKNSTKDRHEWFEKEFEKCKESYEEQTKQNEADGKVTIMDFACRPVAICLGVIIFHDFCGAFTMVNYTGKILAESGSELPPNESAVIVGVIQLIGTSISLLLVDRVGRKPLFAVSCLGTGLCHVILATYIYLSTSIGMDLRVIQWVPVVSFSAILFIASCGALPIPYILLGEMMPDKIRSASIAICLIVSWFESFLLVKIFPIVTEACGLHGSIYLFALCSFIGVFYTVLFVPETKGRSLADIEKSFKKFGNKRK